MSSTSFLAAAPISVAPRMASNASIGFKDWALVCSALGQGLQSLILRKGGIAEGRDGFHFKHEAFSLFPTRYHQQAEKVRAEFLATLDPMAALSAGTVEIRYFFVADWAAWLHDWSVVARLDPFHVWREEVVRERFEYGDQAGLQCAFGRVYRLDPAWTFVDKPSYGGCRSWVNLPDLPASTSFVPVLDDDRHESVGRALRETLQSS